MTIPNGMKMWSVYTSEDTYHKLRELATVRRLKVQDMVREALDKLAAPPQQAKAWVSPERTYAAYVADHAAWAISYGDEPIMPGDDPYPDLLTEEAWAAEANNNLNL